MSSKLRDDLEAKMISRRDFLSQVATALTIAGIAHTIPAAAFEPEQPEVPFTFTDEIRLPYRILGLAVFQGNVIISTEGGVYLAPADGVGRTRFDGDRLLLNLTPKAQKTIYIQCIGCLPHRLKDVPPEDLRIEMDYRSYRYVMWSKASDPHRW